MIVGGRTIYFKEIFTTQLALIQEYVSQYDAKKGCQLTTVLSDFALDVIAANPYIFAEFTGRLTPDNRYRRAVFKRKYVIIYEVVPDRITFLVIYHTSQNPDSVLLETE
jgi:hypothetical protein